jgi:hypothetical protein
MSTGYMSNTTVFYKKPEVRTLRDQLISHPYFDGGMFCPSFNLSLMYCFALFVIVLCLVSNERPVWLNELGSWIT